MQLFLIPRESSQRETKINILIFIFVLMLNQIHLTSPIYMQWWDWWIVREIYTWLHSFHSLNGTNVLKLISSLSSVWPLSTWKYETPWISDGFRPFSIFPVTTFIKIREYEQLPTNGEWLCTEFINKRGKNPSQLLYLVVFSWIEILLPFFQSKLNSLGITHKLDCKEFIEWRVSFCSSCIAFDSITQM